VAVDRNGRISHINPAAQKILGLSEENAASNQDHYTEIISAVENKSLSALKAIETGSGLPSGEKKVTTPDGKELTLCVTVSVLKNRGEEIVGAVELFQDITKLRAMEEQLSQMKILASLGEMAATIAHEIRNPLVGIGGFASLLARDLDDNPRQKDMAAKIVEGVDDINNIIQNLLNFARKEEIEKTNVDLNAYLKQILKDVESDFTYDQFKDCLDIKLDSNRTIPVEIDRQLFRQALLNIVKNGLDLNKKGRPIKVKIASRLLPIEAAHKNYRGRLELSGTESLAEIIIEDNGPGINQKALENLFSPFYTTKEDGVGLGLSIAWKIIKAHAGDIVAESHPGRGTRFTIVLPADVE
jgi:PAS domain S-box-containing protein